MQRPWFYIVMAWLALMIGAAGVAVSLSAGHGHAPIIRIHEALVLAWLLLYLVQPSLIMRGDYRAHMYVGIGGACLALALAISTGLMARAGDQAQRVSYLASLLIFLSFVALGLIFNHRAGGHKRFMTLATIAILWPVWFRLFVWPAPTVLILVLMASTLSLVVCMIRDWMAMRRVHFVYWLFGGALIIEQAVEVRAYGTPLWQAVSQAVFNLLT